MRELVPIVDVHHQLLADETVEALDHPLRHDAADRRDELEFSRRHSTERGDDLRDIRFGTSDLEEAMHDRRPWMQCRLHPDESTAVLIDFDAVGTEQRSGCLGDEERVAETRVEDDVDQLGIGHGADGISDQRPDVGPIEWLEVDRQATTLLLELLDEAFELAESLPEHGARGRDHQDPAVCDQPGETHQESDRIAVGLVEVLPHHHDGLEFGEMGQQVEHRAEYVLGHVVSRPASVPASSRSGVVTSRSDRSAAAWSAAQSETSRGRSPTISRASANGTPRSNCVA